MGASKTEERVKEVSSSSSDSGSEDEQQDSPQQEQQGGDGSPSRSRISRNEKKARKAVLRHGMKQVPDIVKVVLRKAKQWFVLVKPDVYKSLVSDTYVIFGEAKVDDSAVAAQAEVAQRFIQNATAAARTEAEEAPSVEASSQQAKAAADGEECDERDVNLIVSQVGCTPERARKALKTCQNDIVDAILHLTC